VKQQKTGKESETEQKRENEKFFDKTGRGSNFTYSLNSWEGVKAA
jgi:hypothetical protein